jgi:peroxiredoxin
LRDKSEAFRQRGAQILVVDPHEPYRVRHMLKNVGAAADDVAFPILADPAYTVSATYGVAFQMNIHTEWSNRPATFVIDRQGTIRYERRATTFNDRPTPDEILKELDALAP